MSTYYYHYIHFIYNDTYQIKRTFDVLLIWFDNILHIIYTIHVLLMYGRMVALQSGSTSPVYIYGKLCRFQKGDLLMITMSYEALFALVAICSGAGYKLGKDIYKAKK